MATNTTTAKLLDRAITMLQNCERMADAAIARGDVEATLTWWGSMNAWEGEIASLLARGDA